MIFINSLFWFYRLGELLYNTKMTRTHLSKADLTTGVLFFIFKSTLHLA